MMNLTKYNNNIDEGQQWFVDTNRVVGKPIEASIQDNQWIDVDNLLRGDRHNPLRLWNHILTGQRFHDLSSTIRRHLHISKVLGWTCINVFVFQLNPAVSFSFYASNKISKFTMRIYWMSQFAGVFLGAFVARLILNQAASPHIPDQPF